MRSLASLKLTETQAAFVHHLLNGASDAKDAATRAGLFKPQDGTKFLRVPAVLVAIELELRRQLHSDLAPLAFKFVRAVLADPAYGEHVRMKAAQLVLDRAGFVPAKSKESKHDDKPPEDMTTGELRELVARLDHEIADRATLIEPSEPDTEAQVADML